MSERFFNSRGQFVAAREFRYAGKTYKRGEDFPHRRLSVSSRKLRTLWEARKIDAPDLEDEDQVIEEEELPSEEEQLAELEAQIEAEEQAEADLQVEDEERE